jgi:putative ABC transport system permease protein
MRTDSPEIRRHVEQMAAAADVPVEFQEKLATIVERGLWPYQIMSWSGRVLSGLALAMATLGLYGMMSFGVNNRVREIGVRMALGAAAGQVIALLVRQGLQLVTRGVAIGAGGSAVVALLLAAVLPGAGYANDLAVVCLTFATVTVLVFAVTTIACWLPARRATKVDPMVALRVE